MTWIINFVKWNAGVSKYKFHLRADQQQRRDSIEQAQLPPDDLRVDQSQVTHPSAVGAVGYTMTQN